MTFVDFYNDPARARLGAMLNSVPGAQMLLKTAHLEDNLDALAKTAFADQQNRKFPLHTPVQAIVSYLYAKYANANVHGDVLEAIDDALTAYGIDRNALRVVQVKQASYSEEECLFPQEQAYPIRNAQEVKMAEERLLPQAGQLLPMTRHRVFNKLAQAADLHGVKLANASMAYAGRAGTDTQLVLGALVQRIMTKSASPEAEKYHQALAEVHDAIQARPREMRNPNTQAKVAALMLKADKTLGFETLYGPDMLDPLSAVYSATKVAASDAVPMGRYQVPMSSLAALPASFYSDALGPDFLGDRPGAPDPEEIASILATLPADMQDSFAAQLKNAGVPVTEC